MLEPLDVGCPLEELSHVRIPSIPCALRKEQILDIVNASSCSAVRRL
jgi:hypothetical protein